MLPLCWAGTMSVQEAAREWLDWMSGNKPASSGHGKKLWRQYNEEELQKVGVIGQRCRWGLRIMCGRFFGGTTACCSCSNRTCGIVEFCTGRNGTPPAIRGILAPVLCVPLPLTGE